jgi:hypothetical protein
MTSALDDENCAAEYAEAIGLANMARDIHFHVLELHTLLSSMPADLRSQWALGERLKTATQAHVHLSPPQLQRVEAILQRGKHTAFAKAMAEHRLDSSSVLRWWVHTYARVPAHLSTE